MTRYLRQREPVIDGLLEDVEALEEGGGGGGVDPWPTIFTVPLFVSASDGNLDLAADRAHLARIERRSASLEVTELKLIPKNQAGNVDVGIYSHAAGTWTRRASSGSTVLGAVDEVQTISLTAPFTLQPNTDYWLAVALSDGTADVAATEANFDLVSNLGLYEDSSFPLPATITTPTAVTAVPLIFT